MEAVRVMGYKADKQIESDAFQAADKQRLDDENSKKKC